MFIEEK